MNRVIAETIGERPRNPDQGAYDELPEFLKDMYTPRQWQFLTDAEKAGLVRQQTEPDF